MRTKLTHSLPIQCPYCKNSEMRIKANLVVGFSTNKICTNPECRFKFNIKIDEVINGQIRVKFNLIGVNMMDRIGWKGMVSAQRSKVSNAIVTLYRAREAGFNTELEYAVICVKHDEGNFHFFDSYKEVLTYQSKPNLWCTGCKGKH